MLQSLRAAIGQRGSVAVAGVLFVAIFALRLAVPDPNAAILLLCSVPIALLAVQLGLRGGLAAALLSIGLIALWALLRQESIGFTGYATRAVTFLLVGALIGSIADRRRTLEEQNARQFELSLDLLGVAGFDGYFKRVNPAFERALGYSAQELCSRPFLDFVHPDDIQSTEAEAAKLVEVGTDTIDFQNRYRAKDGSYRWIEWTTRAVASEQLLYAAARDITERKLTERHLDAQLRATCVLAECHTIDEALGELLRVVGEATHWPVGAFWLVTGESAQSELRCAAFWTRPGADAKAFESASRRLRLAPGSGIPGRVWEGGQARWVSDVQLEPHCLRADPAMTDGLHGCFVLPVSGSGAVLGVMEFLSDEVCPPDLARLEMLNPLAGQVGQFLERKRGEADLRASERQTRQIIDTAHDAFVAIDERGVITAWNPQAEAVFGWPREEALGRELAATIMPERYREAHRRGLERFMAGGEPRVLDQVLELAGLDRDGREFPVELTISAVQTKNGYVCNAFLRDISRRRALEAELEAARDEAVEASRAKSEFLATMSHEIRTPMNGVIGMTGLLLDSELDREQRDYAQTVRGCGEALLTIINDILDFSKIEAGGLELEIIDFDLRTVIEEVEDLLAERAHVKGLELAALIGPGLSTAVRGDPGRVRQVLINLVGNAIKFTAAGEVLAMAELVEQDAEEIVVRIAVSDTGIGIAAQAQAALFKPFSQADASTTRGYGGTGLGLTISRRLVELMGGEIGVHSAVGHGSTFSFTVRLGKQAQPSDGPARRSELSGLRALIVDDNQTNRTIIEQHVASWGMRSDSAEDGAGALDLLRGSAARTASYDVALLDMEMPGIDGLALAQAIRGDPALDSLALVLLTSSGLRGTASEARQAGIAAYLTKPVHRSHLYDAIATVIGAQEVVERPLVTRDTISQTRARSRPRLLVADDNAANLKLAVAMLARLGYHADVVTNGAEAVQAVSGRAYGAVLMDCQMPEMDGYAATAEIRASEHDAARIPIIAMTAAAMAGEREKCLAAGMDDYISKPVAIDTLEAVLARWVQTVDELAATIAPDAEAAPEQPANDGAFDPDRVAMLRDLTRDGQPDVFESMARAFVDDAEPRVSSLREAAASADRETLAKQAHALKGSAANLGATRLADACLELEQILGSEAHTVTLIETEFCHAKAWLDVKPAATDPRPPVRLDKRRG